jgi:hypothetical protein
MFLLICCFINLSAKVQKEPNSGKNAGSPIDIKQALFSSKLITTTTDGHAVKVRANIKGVQNLYLTITDGGNSYSCDWADWAYPRLIGSNGKTTKLTDLNWKIAKSGWGKAQINKNCGGGPLKINGKNITYGIGAHANSVIHYELPKNHDFIEFQALAGIDNGGSNQKSGTQSSVQFFVSDKPINMAKLANIQQGLPDTDHYPADQFIIQDGLEIKLWAKSPLLFNPTNMDIDHKGRVWVAEGRNYRGKRTQPDGDRIVVVEDKDGDGVAESSHVFVQEKTFISPLGVAVVDNKIIVSQPPDLIVYTDVNRNAVFDNGVDKRDVLPDRF